MLSIIVAHDKNRVIGNNGKLPWSLPSDLEYFKAKTLGKTVIMGERTYNSLPEKVRPLPNRKNIVLVSWYVDYPYSISENPVYGYNKETCGSDVMAIYKRVAEENNEEYFVIGGGKTYADFLPYADRLYVTYIDHEFDGDTYFPEYSTNDWRLLAGSKGVKNEENPYDYYFRIYERKPDINFDMNEENIKQFKQEYMCKWIEPSDSNEK